MGYSTENANRLLAKLLQIVPHAAIVRTDWFPPTAEFGPVRRGMLELLPKKVRFNIPTSDRRQADTAEQIRRHLGLQIDGALEVVRIFAKLADLNPQGTWMFEGGPTTAAPSASADEDDESSAGAALSLRAGAIDQPFLADVVQDLHSLMPGCSAIHATVRLLGLAHGTVRRRVTLRCLGRSGEELAALDTAFFNTHIASLLNPLGGSDSTNAPRAHRWAAQLGANPDDIAGILHDLSLLFVALPTTTLELNDPKSVSAHWAAAASTAA
jgi:hypothetical protein